MVPADVPGHERLVAQVRARLDGATFDANWASGRNLSADEALVSVSG